MRPTTRANAALMIAANQFAQKKQQDPNASDEDVINNLEAVPDVIKEFLKKKVSGTTPKDANLQSDNPLLGQQKIYQQLTERLTRPFRPQMSQGQPVSGVQLPPHKALEYLHNDPDFQSLPSEYQNYAIRVTGGQPALDLHNQTLASMKGDISLDNQANKDALNFSQSPTRMVEKNLSEGKWFVDANSKLMKREKNPVSGMEEISPLSPWETLHAVRESPKTGFGDLSPYINPSQQAGLEALRNNPDANVSDIIQMVAHGKTSFANLQNQPVQSPERRSTLSALNAEGAPSPDRIATLKAMGLPVPQSSLSGTATDAQLNASRAPWYNALPENFPKATAALPAGYGAGQAVRNFVTNPNMSGGMASAEGIMTDKVLPFVYAGVQNTGALADKAVTAGGNFLSGLFGGKQQQPAFGIKPTSVAEMQPKVSELYRNQIPDWLVKHLGTNISNESQEPAISEY